MPRPSQALRLLLAYLGVWTCFQTGAQGTSHRMVARLAQIRDQANPAAFSNLNDRYAAALEKELAAEPNPQRRVFLRYQLAVQWLKAGKTEQSLAGFQAMEDSLTAANLKLDDQRRIELRMLRATAYLRLGEQENCLLNHNSESCILPLSPKAFHKSPRGSRAAIQLLTEQLTEFPQDSGARWLLNLGHMTLGEYPDGVPMSWRIPPKVFESEYPMPRFVDIAGDLGLDVDDLAGGVIAEDFDGDGFLDLVLSAWGFQGQLRFFRNDGRGRLQERTREAGLLGLIDGLNIQQTDYNNDGRPDIWVMRGAWQRKAGRLPNSLLRNNGDGTFTDVTDDAGLLSFHPTQTSAWFDFDGDGWLDVFIGNESTDPKDPDFCELFRNNRNGTFTECAATNGIAVARFVKGVAVGDVDNDGRPDVYVSCLDGSNLLFRNEGSPDGSGKPRFREMALKAGVTEPEHSFPTWFFDYDNDGWEDIFVSGYNIRNVGDIAADYMGLPNGGERPRLFRNNRDGTFSNGTTNAGLYRVCHTMGCNFGDLDNDGWLDFYLATGDPELYTLIPNRMFRNDAGQRFQEVTTATGTGHLQKGHGVAFADFDNDGDQDVYEVLGGAFFGDNYRNALFENPGSTNHWIKIRLEGVRCNRPGIGSRIKVTRTTATGRREIHRTVSSGGSFGSNPWLQHIGLGGGGAETIDVEVFWPASGLRQTFTQLKSNEDYLIREGESVARRLNLPRLQWVKESHANHHHPPETKP